MVKVLRTSYNFLFLVNYQYLISISIIDKDCNYLCLNIKKLETKHEKLIRFTSKTDKPVVQATGFPPKVLKWPALANPVAISFVVATAAKG